MAVQFCILPPVYESFYSSTSLSSLWYCQFVFVCSNIVLWYLVVLIFISPVTNDVDMPSMCLWMGSWSLLFLLIFSFYDRSLLSEMETSIYCREAAMTHLLQLSGLIQSTSECLTCLQWFQKAAFWGRRVGVGGKEIYTPFTPIPRHPPDTTITAPSEDTGRRGQLSWDASLFTQHLELYLEIPCVQIR